MKTTTTGITTLAIALVVTFAHAQQTRRVPSQYKTIQAAINASGSGDTVLVAPRIYYENINITTTIRVVSEAGAAATVIDGQLRGNGVIIGDGAVLDGFTVRGGARGLCLPPKTTVYGGGVVCFGRPTVRNNIITGNGVGGTYCEAYGGGIAGAPFSDPLIVNNVVAGNSAWSHHAYARGGGVYCEKGTLVNNTIFGNDATGWATGRGEGGGVYGANAVTCDNSIVWGNTASYSGAQIAGAVSGSSCWTQGDPLLMDGPQADYHLRYDSPCRNTGTKVGNLPSTDFEGDPRISDGKPDIGADEFHPHLYLTGAARRGGLVHVKIAGKPGAGTISACSLHSSVRNPPLLIPGLGLYYLNDPVVLIAGGSVPAPGIIVVPVFLPWALPTPIDFPMQALIGRQLSNPYIARIR